MGRVRGWIFGYRETVILLGVYNICNGRNCLLESSLRVMSQSNLDLGLFQYTKVPNRIHTRVSAGYHVLAVDALRWHRRGVAVFYKDAPHFQFEAYQPHGPNVSIFQLDSSGRRWIFGCVISTPTTPQLSSTLSRPSVNAPMGMFFW